MTDVVLTHMHMDHCGGLLVDGVKERLRPDLRVHVAAAEAEFWASPDFSRVSMPPGFPQRSFCDSGVTPWMAIANTRLFEVDELSICRQSDSRRGLCRRVDASAVGWNNVTDAKSERQGSGRLADRLSTLVTGCPSTRASGPGRGTSKRVCSKSDCANVALDGLIVAVGQPEAAPVPTPGNLEQFGFRRGGRRVSFGVSLGEGRGAFFDAPPAVAEPVYKRNTDSTHAHVLKQAPPPPARAALVGACCSRGSSCRS